MAESKKYQIAASAIPQFIADQSDPDAERYVFAYTISIENVGTVTAQLISRHWIITDANARVQDVRGLGVVGQQPLLKPGEKFEYTSGCQLDTPVGTMRGSFQMTAEDGTQFEAEIAEFTLSIPRVLAPVIGVYGLHALPFLKVDKSKNEPYPVLYPVF